MFLNCTLFSKNWERIGLEVEEAKSFVGDDRKRLFKLHRPFFSEPSNQNKWSDILHLFFFLTLQYRKNMYLLKVGVKMSLKDIDTHTFSKYTLMRYERVIKKREEEYPTICFDLMVH